MADTEAQKRAKRKYNREKTTNITFRLYQTDADILKHLQAQENKQGYIKSLIREDMKRQGLESNEG